MTKIIKLGDVFVTVFIEFYFQKLDILHSNICLSNERGACYSFGHYI